MNSTDFFLSGKRKMVKIFLIALLSICPSLLNFSNPIIPPAVLFEIYFSPTGWQIEIMNNEYFSEYENLDSLWLMGQYDTARFVPGHSFLPGELEVITASDLLTPMIIEQTGDYIRLCVKYEDYFYYIDGLIWGDPYSITAPVGEQSIARQGFTLPDSYWDYWEVKEQPNTIDSIPGQVVKRAAFSGYVMDKEDQPMVNIYLDYCYDGVYYHYSDPTVPLVYTNNEGYFNTNDMYCRKYNVYFRIGEFYGPIIGDTTINIEPDSANYYEFKLDTLLTEINEIKSLIPEYSIFNIPNPSSFRTKFIIGTSALRHGVKGVIKIYSESGYIVDILPVEIKNVTEEVPFNFKDKALSSGMYFYNLEIKNHKVASGKLLFSR